jgi:hypothetical protein
MPQAPSCRADLELEHTAFRPADELGRLVGEKDVRDEAEQETDGTDVEHEGVDQQHPQDVAARPRAPSDGEVDERQHQAQQQHDDVDHALSLSASAAALNLQSDLQKAQRI